MTKIIFKVKKVSEVVPVVPEDLGNTNIQIPIVPRCAPAKRWCFTLNNYTEEDIGSIGSVVPLVCDKWIYSREVGESGTPHLQGFVSFKVKSRPFNIFKIPRIHWEKARGNDMAQVIYCEKDGDIVEKVGLPKQPKPIKVIVPDRPYQKFILDIIKKEPDERTIYWFFDRKGGIGKTSLSKYLVVNKGAVIMSGKSADVRNGIVEYKKQNGITPELIVYNVPRSLDKKYLSYEGLENCKDMLFYSGKYEGAMICGNAPHLIVFANDPPNLEKLSADRWEIYEIDETFNIHLWDEEPFINEYDDELDL